MTKILAENITESREDDWANALTYQLYQINMLS